MSAELTIAPGAPLEHAAQRISRGAQPVWVPELLDDLRRSFRTEFECFNAATAEPLHEVADRALAADRLRRASEPRAKVTLIEDQYPLGILAIPLQAHATRVVAVGVFVIAERKEDESLDDAANVLGLNREEAAAWIDRQMVWDPTVLLSMGQLTRDKFSADERIKSLETEVRDVSQHLSSSYEEISLLYRLTQNLKLSSHERDLAAQALEWLADVLPVESLAIQLTHVRSSAAIDPDMPPAGPALLTYGPSHVECNDVTHLVDHFGLAAGARPLIVNRRQSSSGTWPWPSVRELVIVPLSEGRNCFGWLVAINHTGGGEFGTVEASLLNTVGAILGIHSGNAELYFQQREIFAGVVRALTSAIDAKDPYTCGHSDRVARVAVRLAQQLGCDAKQRDTIYLSGLLHDIGKIGIDDNVLRKPGKLTEAEYEHIKTHTEIGYKILVGIKRLDDVLPVVLHHHEQWDGGGYPHGLAADAIPFLARIVAVADAFDAMGSDRPYRPGMSDDKLDAILREGAGTQWDATVVEAFFHAREDVRRIAKAQEKHPPVDLFNWN